MAHALTTPALMAPTSMAGSTCTTFSDRRIPHTGHLHTSTSTIKREERRRPGRAMTGRSKMVGRSQMPGRCQMPGTNKIVGRSQMPSTSKMVGRRLISGWSLIAESTALYFLTMYLAFVPQGSLGEPPSAVGHLLFLDFLSISPFLPPSVLRLLHHRLFRPLLHRVLRDPTSPLPPPDLAAYLQTLLPTSRPSRCLKTFTLLPPEPSTASRPCLLLAGSPYSL
jgi:hypothetical protein